MQNGGFELVAANVLYNSDELWFIFSLNLQILQE